jgi:hypothetical protein
MNHRRHKAPGKADCGVLFLSQAKRNHAEYWQEKFATVYYGDAT